MKKAGMYITAVVLNLAYLLQKIDSSFAQITESEKEYIPGESETSQLITSSFEVRRAVIALIAIAAVAFIGLWYYWRKTGQWARDRFVEQHGQEALTKRNFFQGFPRSKNRQIVQNQDSPNGEISGSADL